MHSKNVSTSGVTESKKAEQKSLMRSSLRDHSVKGCNKMKMVEDPIQYQSCGRGGENYNNVGYSWSPRCYACSFCEREFRSAQALGGHMNVHRRDRARLRQSPPPLDHPVLNLNFSPNPNPNFSSSPTTCLVSSPSCPTPSAPHLNKWVSPLYSPSTQRAVKKSKFLKTSVGLSLEIGHSKEDLDLELRLGYP